MRALRPTDKSKVDSSTVRVGRRQFWDRGLDEEAVMQSRFIFSAAVVLFFSNFMHAESQPPAPWQPKRAALMTQWAGQVSPDNALREYPRPQLERPEWVNLNGLWDYAIVPSDEIAFPKKYQGKILVPYPVESALSGVMKSVGTKNRVFYNRTFRLPESWKGRKVLL